MLQPVDQPSALDKDRTRHKFMIQAAYAKNDEIPVDEFWKSVDTSEIMDSKLKVVFNNLNVNGSDVHSGQRSSEGSVYNDEAAQSHQQPVQRRNVQPTSHENRRSSPVVKCPFYKIIQVFRTLMDLDRRSACVSKRKTAH